MEDASSRDHDAVLLEVAAVMRSPDDRGRMAVPRAERRRGSVTTADRLAAAAPSAGEG